jgi:phosphate starvation-inducible PhoH-like protein
MKATPNQLKIMKSFDDPFKKAIIVTGPAGSGKTKWVTTTALKLLRENRIKYIIVTRPTVGVNEQIGYLPGDMEKKMRHWVSPVIEYTSECYCPSHSIRILPIGFMRGHTFKDTFVIADEMQNATREQIKMLLTRFGENSYLGITGDLFQSDIDDNGLEHFLLLLKNKEKSSMYLSIQHIELHNEDIKRDDFINDILDIYTN